MLPTQTYVHFRGAQSVKVLVQAAHDQFAAEHPGTSLVVVGGSTDRGFRAVLDGTTHFGMVASDPSVDVERLAKRTGAKLVSTVIGFDGVVAYVHPDNPIDSLTIENLHDIYTGDVVNWSDLGGSDAAITALSQYPDTGSYGAWSKLVIGTDGNYTTKIKPLEASALLRQVVASPNAIGFGPVSLAPGAPKILKINDVAHSTETIKAGTYALRRALMLARDEKLAPVAQTFLDWFIDPAKGQQVIQRLGVVPLK
jgi:phosphate transport system substrate-binding protein